MPKYSQNSQVLNAEEVAVNESKHEFNYEEVVVYSETFMQDAGVDDDLIIEDYGDSSQHSQDLQQPIPTLGTPKKVKNKKTEQKKISKEKQIHICEICGNIYPRNYELKVHMRRHRNERIHECE